MLPCANCYIVFATSATYSVHICIYKFCKYLRALESNYCCNILNIIIIPGATPNTIAIILHKNMYSTKIVCLVLETAQVTKRTLQQ